MALRAELIGPYCLILVTSSVCADSVAAWGNLCTALTARMTLLELTAAALKLVGGNISWLGSRVIGQQLTAESELARTPGIRLSN